MIGHCLVLAAVAVTQGADGSAEAVIDAGLDLTVPTLLFCGILFVLLETIIPGGVLGVFALLLILAAVVIATKNHGGPAGLLTLALGLIGSIAALGVGWHFLPRMPFASKIFLEPSTGMKFPPATAEGKAKATIQLGDRGESLSDLRPAGMARIGEWRLDVVTRGEYVAMGTPLEVLAIDGTRVVVRTLRDDAS